MAVGPDDPRDAASSPDFLDRGVILFRDGLLLKVWLRFVRTTRRRSLINPDLKSTSPTLELVVVGAAHMRLQIALFAAGSAVCAYVMERFAVAPASLNRKSHDSWTQLGQLVAL